MGPGLDEDYDGLVYAPVVPDCHVHCDGCMKTGCPHPAHRPDWTLGYVATYQGDSETWLCPLCFDWYRDMLNLTLDPSVPFPRAPLARLGPQ